jgi:hypothetical protein
VVRWFAAWKATRARRGDGINVAEADRLVTGHCPEPRPYGLGLLLDAARAPATAEELVGEEQAVARMVAARRTVLTASPDRRSDAKVPPTARKVVVKLAAGLAVLIVAAGAAAETGSLPAALQQHAHDLFSLLGVPAPATESRRGEDQSTEVEPLPVSPAPELSGGVSPTAITAETPNPDAGLRARALCQEWIEAGRDPDGKAMNGQSWRDLVEAAGEKARVPAVCDALLGSAPSVSVAPSPAARSGAGPAMPSHSAGGKESGRVKGPER